MASPASARGNLGLAVLPLGQCRLVYSTATALLLKAYQGNQIFAGGAYRTIPSGGVPLSNAGLLATSLPPSTTYLPYFIYAKWVSNALTLIASTTGHVTDATYGQEVKSDDAAATLVGLVALDGTPGSQGTFADTPAKRYVASWFNRLPRDLSVAATAGSTNSGTPVEISSANRVNFVVWGDAAVSLNVNGSQYQTASGYYTTTQLQLDGNIIGGAQSHFHATGAKNYSLGVTAQVTPTEGLHYGGFKGSIDANSGTWTAAMGGTVLQ